MILASVVAGVIKRLFKVFKRVFIPDRTDFLGSLLLSIPLYFLFGLSLIFLLPLIILGVFVVFIIRRLWKVLVLYWTVKVMRKKTAKELDKIRRLF
jgi:hypothetical protein